MQKSVRRTATNLQENIAYCETESEKLTDAMSRRNKLTNELHELKVAENRYKEEMMEKKRLEDTVGIFLIVFFFEVNKFLDCRAGRGGSAVR